jgi:hypothetical protein
MSLLSLLIFVLDVVAVIDCLQNQKDTQKKILWVILILLLPLVGLILYYLMGKENKK